MTLIRIDKDNNFIVKNRIIEYPPDLSGPKNILNNSWFDDGLSFWRKDAGEVYVEDKTLKYEGRAGHYGNIASQTVPALNGDKIYIVTEQNNKGRLVCYETVNGVRVGGYYGVNGSNKGNIIDVGNKDRSEEH